MAPQRTSTTWPRIRRAGRCANIVVEGQEELGRRFARAGTDRFAGVHWTTGPSGCPVLEDALAWVDCEVLQETDGGDQLLVVGRVLDLAVLSDAPRCSSSGAASRRCARRLPGGRWRRRSTWTPTRPATPDGTSRHL